MRPWRCDGDLPYENFYQVRLCDTGQPANYWLRENHVCAVWGVVLCDIRGTVWKIKKAGIGIVECYEVFGPPQPKPLGPVANAWITDGPLSGCGGCANVKLTHCDLGTVLGVTNDTLTPGIAGMSFAKLGSDCVIIEADDTGETPTALSVTPASSCASCAGCGNCPGNCPAPCGGCCFSTNSSVLITWNFTNTNSFCECSDLTSGSATCAWQFSLSNVTKWVSGPVVNACAPFCGSCATVSYICTTGEWRIGLDASEDLEGVTCNADTYKLRGGAGNGDCCGFSGAISSIGTEICNVTDVGTMTITVINNAGVCQEGTQDCLTGDCDDGPRKWRPMTNLLHRSTAKLHDTALIRFPDSATQQDKYVKWIFSKCIDHDKQTYTIEKNVFKQLKAEATQRWGKRQNLPKHPTTTNNKHAKLRSSLGPTRQSLNTLRTGAHALKSIAKTTIGIDRATDEQVEARLNICRHCPGHHATYKDGDIHTCGPMLASMKRTGEGTPGACGCILHKKARDLAENCPFNWWPRSNTSCSATP